MGVAAAILFNQRGGMVLQITNRQRRFRIREKNSLLSRVDNSPSFAALFIWRHESDISPNLSSFHFRKFFVSLSDFEVQLVMQRAVKKQERRKVVSYF